MPGTGVLKGERWEIRRVESGGGRRRPERRRRRVVLPAPFAVMHNMSGLAGRGNLDWHSFPHSVFLVFGLLAGIFLDG